MQEPSETFILGIDTTGPVDSVALARGEHIVASLSLRQSLMSSRPLLRLIDVLCVQAQCTLADVTALAVNVGPGAFTGLRVGLSTAQGLAVAYGKPLLGCTAFEALVSLVPQWQGGLCPVVQARKGEVYAALYHMDGDGGQWTLEEKLPGMVVTPDALCALIRERTLFLGSGVTAYRSVLTAALRSDAVCLDLVEARIGLAASVARWGTAQGQRQLEEDPLRIQPFYIRPADARLPRIAANAADVTSMTTGGAAAAPPGGITR
ncbi:tRNA (adenosine(37)-N6)-threonylcarbamoyltransferase complex dimerization subunit type 1 TsaB [Candidatus Entotheonella palauensis]|uniref:Gcp-like domain-containing protein n=1 Tax=Candidatus Entotheonella gemina TaxID=1429439 RepID=W4L6F6_9BACT|nr:tRNA (adenosine(37)-N6)-threonylcarbamoyltransferase complex dimerization subunit type 1 TsaB [Candidatus Entotheonella palauensis]ETW93469.1 MAG: hypothetical protein ETSY2_51365 [Candidatus Entotheonella gemina]